VDIVGDLPVILMEIDPDNNNSIEKTYIYANGQILAQHNGDHTAGRYFYLHDRLGSVRLIIDSSGNVKNRYTYKPFGEFFTAETEETIGNPFGFTGQWYDAEIGEYFMRARMYDPHINRFTGRDPVFGEFEQPLTLHKYLYCGNNPINFTDTNGKWAVLIGMSLSLNAKEGSEFISALTKEFGITGGALARNAIIGSIYDAFLGHVGITGGAGTAFGYGPDGGFIGSVYWAAAGPAQGFGLSVTCDYALSNAQSLQDLAGTFVEIGGSRTVYRPLGPFLNGLIGGTVSYSLESDIWLATGSFGGGVSAGYEAHAFVGKSWVAEW